MTTPEVPRSHGAASSWAAWLPAIVLVGALYGLLAWAFVPRFETMDDVAMAMWSSGLCMALEPQSHIIFSHEIVGRVLQHLYLLWPGVGWYGWLHGTVLFVSSVAVCRALLRIGGWLGAIAFLGYFAFTQVDAFVLMQFTKTAFYATLAGATLLALANIWTKADRSLLVGGCALALIGSLIRPESFVFACVICLPALAIAWWRQDGTVRAAVRQRLASLAIFLAAPLLLIGASSVLDRLGPWERYYNYRIYRARALDFGDQIVYNGETRHVFDEIHWTENDLAMLRQASYFDPGVFSAENYRHLLRAFPKPWLPKEPWIQLSEFVRSLQAPPYAIIFIAGSLVLLAGWRRQNAWSILVALLSVTFLLTAILFFVKWPPHRVVLPALGSTYCLLVWLCFRDASRPRRRLWLAAACGAGLVLATGRLLPDSLAANRAFQRNSTAVLAEFAGLHSNRSQLYFAWQNNFPYELTFLPFNHHPELFRDHLQVGSWGIYNPTAEAMLRHFAVARPYQNLVNNPHFFLIAQPEGVATYRRFMRESYQQEVEVAPVIAGHYLLVWRVLAPKK